MGGSNTLSAEERADHRVEVVALRRLLHLGRDPQWETGRSGDLSGHVGCLARVHPSEEDGVAATPGTDREVRRIDPMMDHPGDGDMLGRRCLVMGDRDHRHPTGNHSKEMDEVLVEWAMVRGHNREVGKVP